MRGGHEAVSPIVIVLCALAGLFIGSAVWNIARNQASKRPLFEPAACLPGDGVLPVTTWLPFFGFGTARSCPADGAVQSPRRLLFELAVAAYFGLAAWRIDDGLDLTAVIVFALPLLVIFLVDSWTRLIYTNVIALGVLLGIAFGAFDGWRQLVSSATAMVVAALIFIAFYVLAILIYRNPKVVPFGLGDVYLAGMIGAMVRLDEIGRALIYGIFLAGATMTLLLVLKRVNRKQAMPYGPYLVLGALIALIA
jgi:leader peptidase (prepilin peptidase) / N-methyltransferase